MIAFDTYTGFYILLLIPLLYWHQRRKSATREETSSLYPLLEHMQVEEKKTMGRRFRVPRGPRNLLLSLCLASLAVSYNGIHFLKPALEPGRWLIVLDNCPSGKAAYGDSTVDEELKRRLRIFVQKLDDADRLTLLTTSPEPDFAENMGKQAFLKRIETVEGSDRHVSIEELKKITRILSRQGNYRGITILTPRSRAWREEGGDDVFRSWIPPDGEVLTGNAGITVLELTPTGPEKFDLYLRTASSELDIETLEMDITTSKGTLRTETIPVMPDGSGELFLPDITLPSGQSRFDLRIKDILEADNSGMVYNLPQGENEISVLVHGGDNPFLESFFKAFPRFRPDLTGFSRSVHIINGSPPASEIDHPALIIFPTQSFEEFTLRRIWAVPLQASFHPGHPAVSQAMGFRRFRPAKIVEYQVPRSFKVLAQAEGIPLVAAGERNGHPLVVWFFDPEDNGIYLDPAFPMLLNSTLLWLTGGDNMRARSDLCQLSPVPPTDSDWDQQRDRFFQCTELVHEAGVISIPELDGIALNRIDTQRSERKGLDGIFLIIAFVILLILSLGRMGDNGWLT